MTAALVPAQVLTGRVTYADTGKGVPHAPLEVMASHGGVAIPAEFETDDEGRFRVNPPPADRSLQCLGLSAGRTALPDRRANISSGPRARSNSPSTSPYRAAY